MTSIGTTCATVGGALLGWQFGGWLLGGETDPEMLRGAVLALVAWLVLVAVSAATSR